ncbi:MAG: diguanylate cyclase [Burkholderiales bacterium]|nr:diguanylate cyclase [Burkholderiales bacterium]
MRRSGAARGAGGAIHKPVTIADHMSSSEEREVVSAPAKTQAPAGRDAGAASGPPIGATPAAQSTRRRAGLGFAKRARATRILGLAFGFLAVGAVLFQDGAHPLVWAALVANAFVWPHAAYALAARSAQPYRAEVRNMLVDSAMGGIWIALTGFNLLPSALLAAMLSMDKLSVGGVRLLARGTAVLGASCLVAAAFTGFAFRPAATMLTIVACLPLLFAYPLAVGAATYRLSRSIRDQNRALAERSRIDGLSGVLTRGHWEDVVANEFQRFCRTGHPVSLLMIDIDHFRQINDRHGNPAGDQVIRNVAALLRETLRSPDTVGRYGGGEFGIVLPDTDAEGAFVIAERIRERVADTPLAREGNIRGTVSIGIAEADVALSDTGEWIVRADRALYRAKALGRNRTVRTDAPSS